MVGMQKSNCLIYAFGKWCDEGGYVVIRRSMYGWWPHFLWTADFHTFYQFIPFTPEHRLLPPLIFIGYVKVTTYNLIDLP